MKNDEDGKNSKSKDAQDNDEEEEEGESDEEEEEEERRNIEESNNPSLRDVIVCCSEYSNIKELPHPIDLTKKMHISDN